MPQMFGAMFPLPVLSEKITWRSSNAVAAGATRYPDCYDQGGEINGGDYASEILSTVFLVTRGGLIGNLVAHSAVVPGVGQSFTYTVLVNGVPTVITCTTSGGVLLNSSDLVNTAHVVIGDRVTVQVVVSAGGAVTGHAMSIMKQSPSTRKPYERTNYNSQQTTIPANSTRYIGSAHRIGHYGGALASETWPSIAYLATRKGSLRNLVALAVAAPGAGETFVYTVRVNYVNTTVIVTLSGAAQITGTDLANVAQVDVGDRITLQVVTSLGAAVTAHAAAFDFEEGDYRAG